MRQRLWTTFVLILLLLGATLFLSWPKTKTIHIGSYFKDVSLQKGLDLQGGSHLVYQADVSKVAAGNVQGAMEGVRDVIEGRVNGLGVGEPDIRLTTVGNTPAISIDLPGVSDIAKAKDIIGTTAKLEFKDENGNTVLEGSDLVPGAAQAGPVQTASSNAVASSNTWQVTLNLTGDGKTKFAQATSANIGKTISIYLDDQLVSSPTVQSAITDGQAVISGNFTAAQAQDFAVQLNYGALPVPISLVQEQTVGASLGTDAINQSVIAGIIGMLLIVIFLIAYYRGPGVLAILALIGYASLNIALYKLLPVTITLAGLAGFIISAGIATDTNILTFERLKEELRMGKPVPVAVQEAFRRAWTSIRDSHISGLISASIIFLFGSGSVRGFAVVLIIGTLLSLFSAITVTRNWMLLVAGSRLQKLLSL